ncbi:MAG: bifunctional diaminohydroxyphosphoribosylaminopyrimidine deaminase/5-amino-6-(5-phosphoribosylamino)uracil reductase RibD [Planctomycetota bacterium]|jgi:diaminohydroxyphosphoribosylaminopyrimidine deaminase/5-amino-6-(5-phosphoribosylamino)uracil reductase
MDTDRKFMARAIELAARGRGRVEPNPVVGAVVVRDGSIVGEGHHARFGGDHAEVAALRAAGADAAGATLYVTLEPCAHRGKTPPCADAVLEAGVTRVVIAARDPNPRTAGKGPARLREAGLELSEGVLEAESRALNAPYERHRGSGLPWTIAKWAMSADGKIGDVDGGSRYITGPEARRLVHEIRGAVDAVVVGIGTVLADDPDLSPREGAPTCDPVRVVLDSRLRTPSTSVLVRSARERPTWLVTGEDPDVEAARRLEGEGCRVLTVPRGDRGLDLTAAFRTLFREGRERVLLEGGGEVHASAFLAGVVHQVMAFMAPIVLGGSAAPSPLGGSGLRRISEALRLVSTRVTPLGEDVLLEGLLP